MSSQFEDYCKALKYYKQKWLELNEHFQVIKSGDLMTMHKDKEQNWCEDYGEDVQFSDQVSSRRRV